MIGSLLLQLKYILPNVTMASVIDYSDICNNSNVASIMIIIGYLINIIKWLVPLVIIVLGMLDFSKAIISNDNEANTKAASTLVRRLIAGIVIFFVPTLIRTMSDLLLEFDIYKEDNPFISCTNCMFNVSQCQEDIKILKQEEEKRKEEEKEYENENDIISSPSITLTSQYEEDGSLRYMLYTPSTANSSKKTPLIVWLHGSGEQNASESLFKASGLQNVLNNWTLDGFNAYVLCPISTGDWISNRQQVYELIEKIVAEKNIDTNKIVLAGHSMGGIGVQTIADGRAEYFSSLVILSGFNAGVDLEQFKSLPIRAYSGTLNDGEYSSSYNFTIGKFSNVFGEDNVYIIETSHGNLPNKAFNLDENNDNKSDLVEWMLKQ